MIMIDEKTKNIIKKIIFRFLDSQKNKVFIFGSHALGNAVKFSDIDIGIQSDKVIDLIELSAIEEVFEESDLPYKVEVVDFSTVSEQFKKVALEKIIPLN
ncbi:MAG: DNA polymerase beta subunit [uncultured bacterium]|nr:MAG: DNA polymerase beta subunit [uncultured bacterium]